MSTELKCPHCQSGAVQEVAPYKVSSKSHRPYLISQKLMQCQQCRLGFADPMPSLKQLQEFYLKVYRRGYLNPYRVGHSQRISYSAWSDAQFKFIGETIDIASLTSVADLGCGYGFLVREFLRRRPKLRVFAFEEDLEAAEYLKRYGVILNPSNIPNIDLCIGSHSLEHFTAPSAFFDMVARLNPTYLFIELPNCDNFSPTFLKRAYDSPHLLFFSKESLEKVCKTFGWFPLRIETTGWSLEDALRQWNNQKSYIEMLERRSYLWRWSHTAVRLSKDVIRHTLPIFKRPTTPIGLEHDWYRYGGARWSLRALFKRNVD